MEPSFEQPVSDSRQNTRGLIRDFSAALEQQMFFWGRDVIHRDGNLLLRHGFERLPSKDLNGCSRYRVEFRGNLVELHGACAGHYSRKEESYLFIRNRRRSFLYQAAEPPTPGRYAEGQIFTDPPHQLFEASCRFLEWWLTYESWLQSVTEIGYRDHCHQLFRKLPKSRLWLPPDQALLWLREYARKGPHALPRARDWQHIYP